ncbi:tetratricopeptide repeat protein [Segniliparus rugosus]|uniref:Uncharacterized protein n=1 Tax=Segniliparus rugosus (strain ATCC BAA-974 / DSM 45345 / CCUG 50838 / CIP 108380 / JCM 13579 / CDC 945) TaxID=679197 RepID=E5XU95_SEGRC|nr:tetratricopeptide repeat protein [Segniliparus rugosus]EFV12094.1 hypothetical protein HMPREF9336_03067 [Segniliparus rugosus ATCC BAA-974]
MAEARARQRAAALLELGRHAEAEALIRQGLAAEPHDFLFLSQLARSLIGQGKAKAALAVSRELAAQQPESAYAHRLLAVCHAMRGRLRLAEEAARQAVALDPEDGWNYFVLADSMRATVSRRWEMRDASVRAVELDPHEASFHLLVGRLHLRVDPELARRSLEEVLRLEPENAEAHRLLVESNAKSVGLAETVDGVRHSLRLDPMEPEQALRSLGDRLGRPLFLLNALWLALVVAVGIAIVEGGAVGAFGRVAVAFVLVALAFFGHRFHRQLPNGGWRLIWLALRGQPFVALVAASTAVGYATVAASAAIGTTWSLAVVGLGAAQRFAVHLVEFVWNLLRLPVLLGRLAWLKARAMWPEGRR